MSIYIKELIMLADILDSRGFVKEAEEIDNIIKNAADIHDIIQRRVQEETSPDHPSPRVVQFVHDLDRALESMVKPDGIITYDVKESIMMVAQNLLKENVRSYMTPGTGHSGLSMLYKTKNDVIELVDSIIELEDELESRGVYEGQDLGEEEHRDTFERLKKLYNIVNRIKNGRRPEDPETYRLIKDYYNERRGKEVW